MLDIGGWEFLLIVVLGIIIIGPKDLPGAIRTVTAFVRKAREMAREFQSGLEEIAHDTELKKLADEVTGGASPSVLGEELRQEMENTIDPGGEMRDSFADGFEDVQQDLEEAVQAGYDGDPGLAEAVADAADEGNGACRDDAAEAIAAGDDAAEAIVAGDDAPAAEAGESGDRDAPAP